MPKTTLDRFFSVPKPLRTIHTKRKMRIPKADPLYRISVSVRAGGKPRSSHPWFSVAGGLLGSTGASIRTKVKLAEKLSHSDRRMLEKTLEGLGFEEKWKSRMGTSWSGKYFESIQHEPRHIKAQTKIEKQSLKTQWLLYHKQQLEPYIKIAREYGGY